MTSRPIRIGYVYLLSIPLLLLAFFLRFDHLLARIFHIDEFISMLAVQMTAQRGAPILPSGLLYHQGLLLSYLAALFVRLSGFVEEIARWPSLLAGMVTVAGMYLVGRRLFSSQAAALFALTLAALDATMILWSGRARMYALAFLFMLFALYFLARGTFLEPRRWYRVAAALCFLGAVLSHSVSVVALPVWLLSVVIIVIIGHKQFGLDWYRRSSIWVEAAIIGLIVLLAVGFGFVGQIPFLSASSDGGSSGEGGALAVIGKFLDPGVSWQRIDDYLYYYSSSEYWLPSILAGLAWILAWVSAFRRRATRRDMATLFLGLVFVLMIAELSLALPSTWRKSRYLFILCHPAYLLLAADGLARLLDFLVSLFRTRVRPRAVVSLLIGVAVIVVFWRDPIVGGTGSESTGGYDTAFEFVAEQWQDGDQVMTVHPSASYLYLGRADYYAAEKQSRVMVDDESEELVDRYVGSDFVDSEETLNQAFSNLSGRLWFVVDQDRLFERYGPGFTQQVFAQMDTVSHMGRVLVFLSRPYPRPAPVEPSVNLDASFADKIALGGHHIDFNAIAPDGTLQLTLYWRPLSSGFTKPYKVFVQFRDEENQIIAQADHFILEGMLGNETLAQLRDRGEWLRDTAELTVPADLPSGNYRLMVGMYDPDTFERLPVVADASGENAVVLQTVTIP